ncbi:MAG: 2OG-Fe(II) oxygenase [Cognatishimia sp.]|uniref:2OG-Fe(II) oxygenase n=1 Tax=Cognatishimia sp. 1_MG-2023 TaxID=3062642 RepID=UPI0026E1A6B3|nr:2OG-Fe(II) oxygenase [Cognatishimia sp. 1_MG-2023]MDO6727136.1 2OG-Fe(II) oxygenase [Cognatishimia sp. 1_MG-2023]
MTNAAYPIDPNSLLIKTAAAKSLGATHAETYQSGEPYNHICIDNFLPTEAIDRVIEDLKQLPEPESDFSRPQENLKSSYIPERLPEYTKNLFYAFNSRSFIAFLESMTGIQGLIPDPYFFGAGIHKTQNGGHLDIHADFNVHSVMRVERRLNVLIYLNHDWQAEWGGNFEIWDKQMTQKMASFVPTYNRMVCFSTGSDTFHGNPEPVNHPNGEPRQSIALYYYTATWDGTRKEHTTLFKPRPGSGDQEDRQVARREKIQDILPPIVYRKIAGHLHRIGL